MNQRGQYGNRQVYRQTYYQQTYVGDAGSIIPHTPGDIENELDQLNGEIMQFGQEVLDRVKKVDDQIKAEQSAMRAIDKANFEQQDIAYRASQDPKLPPEKKKELLQRAVEMLEAAKKFHNDLDDKFLQRKAEVPLAAWSRSTWQPFSDSWRRFRSEKKDIPLQMLPGSGTWDRIQDFRRQFIDTRKTAPFKPTGPEPTSDEGRRDPGLTDLFKNLGSLAKVAVYGGLGVIGLVAITSLVSHARSGRDPVSTYAGVYRETRGKRALSTASPLELPAGEPA